MDATTTEMGLLSVFNPGRSMQAHGITPEIGWGFCYSKAASALLRLSRRKVKLSAHSELIPSDWDASYWQRCRYVEGWSVTHCVSPDPGHRNPPIWEPHGFLVNPAFEVIDPIAAMGLIRFGADSLTGQRWIAVSTFRADRIPVLASLPHGDGSRFDSLANLPAFRAARHRWEAQALAVANHLHTAKHGWMVA